MEMNRTARAGLDWFVLGAFAAAVLMGGTNVVAVRFSNRELAPFWGAGLRFIAAAALLLLAAQAMRLALPKGRALVGAALCGVLSFGAYYAFGYWGLLHVPAGLASVFLATIPLLTFLFAVLHGIEPFRWRGFVQGSRSPVSASSSSAPCPAAYRSPASSLSWRAARARPKASSS